MTEETSGILLNLASIPVKKKKVKTNQSDAQVNAKSKAPFTVPLRPGNVTAIKPPGVIKSKPIISKSKPISILKKGIITPSHSFWKKFKDSNKRLEKNNILPTISKPDRLIKKKVKVKENFEDDQPSFKKVSFHDEVTKETENSSTEVIKTDKQHLNSNFKKSLAEDNDSYFYKSENENFYENENTDKKKKKKKNFFESNMANLQKFMDTNKTKQEYNTGKITSLFHNNPEIPDIPHRAVKPVKEDVFSNLCFEDLNLHPFMVKFLKESMGLTKMTTVQEKSIPILLENKDALIRSQTGSGKTLAYSLPLLHKLQEIRPKINRSDGVLALIVLPTRELALQTYEVFNKLVKSYTWIVPGYLVGGEKRKSEKARLRKGITVLIGTPGRLIDHIQHTKALTLEKVAWLIIDEADRLLDMGYEKDVSVLLEALNANEGTMLQPNYMFPEKQQTKEKSKSRQTILLSATLSAKVQELAGLSLKDPVFVDACDKNLSSVGHVPVSFSDIGTETDTMVLPESLVQKYVVVPPKLKLVTLATFILWKSKEKQKKMLVFLGTQDMVDYHTELLSLLFKIKREEKDSDSEDPSYSSTTEIELFKLHGNMKQNERSQVFQVFRKSSFGVLLCTDVAARGLDLPEVDWVIQYTGPISVSDYVHRVGRTARGGQSGSSIIILTPNEVSFIEKLENCQIRLREEKMETCLNHLLKIDPRGNSVEEEATKLQMTFEKMISENEKLYDLACKAYSSWSRFYATYPKNMRDAFSVKTVHQGHYAKSFALRDSPSVIVDYARKKNLNEKRFPRKRISEEKIGEKKGNKFVGKSRISNISEFDSGLEPLPKKKR